jgi:serine/threonine protein kinase
VLNQGQPVNHEDCLNHRYQILRLLGQSHSSQTYLTLDTATQTTAVVKQIKIDELNLESRLQQLKDLQHRRLSRWLDFSIEQGYLYGAQEYIAGESLATRLQRVGCFSVAELWLVLEQILPVLQYLHRQGLLHGDIRPENLICRTGLDDLVLVDLAIMPTGNPEYAAPEQMQGQPGLQPALASDLFSLGLTGLTLLTGLRPMEIWDAENSNSWLICGAMVFTGSPSMSKVMTATFDSTAYEKFLLITHAPGRRRHPAHPARRR